VSFQSDQFAKARQPLPNVVVSLAEDLLERQREGLRFPSYIKLIKSNEGDSKPRPLP
jgi:hypothetical protein